MTREEAMQILMNERGHNYDGADNIVDYLEKDGRLETITHDELVFESINCFED